MSPCRNLSVAFILLVVSSSTADASILNTTGAVQFIALPESVLENDLASDTTAVVFNESQFVTLPHALALDVTSPGTYSNTSLPALSPGSLPIGTRVNSFYLHADSITGSTSTKVFDGTITLSNRILGLQVVPETLDTGIGPVGEFGIVYPFGVGNSGIDFGLGDGTDTIILSPDMRTITIHLQNVGGTDQLRIVTAVPEPAGLHLLGIATLSLAVLRMARRPNR